ncbi:MAG TPA: hypothetical protein VIH07_02385 [Candidatus Humimicrobiaceae bacterium]
MKKNKLYFILAILSTIFLLSFAAICNQCGTAAEEEAAAEEEEEAAEEEEEAAEEEEEIAEEEEEEAAEEEEEEVAEEEEEEEAIEKVEPTISISIYEGPTYNPADGVCYYRVKATVTGSPSPDVDWSKDDSNSAWGTRKAQINLDDPGDTYTLTATATNSEGTDTDSIELSWGCEEEVAEEPEVHEVNVPVALSEGGYIVWDETVWYPHDSIFAGDSTSNKLCRGYMGFEIGGLAGVTVTEVSLSLSPEQVWGDPTFLGSLWIDVVDWGAGPLEMADFNIAYETIQSFNTSIITSTHSKLKTELQDAINDGKSRFRIRIRYTTLATDGDSQWDGWDYLINEVVLHVSYTE